MSYGAEPDVDLLRRTALELESLERSPPEPIILGLAEFSGRLGCSLPEVAAALARLADLRLIEGPGELDEAWLFRRITNRGHVFLAEVRSQARWDEIKLLYQDQMR